MRRRGAFLRSDGEDRCPHVTGRYSTSSTRGNFPLSGTLCAPGSRGFSGQSRDGFTPASVLLTLRTPADARATRLLARVRYLGMRDRILGRVLTLAVACGAASCGAERLEEEPSLQAGDDAGKGLAPPPFVPCANSVCGDPCKLCDPSSSDCVNPLEPLVCNAVGACVDPANVVCSDAPADASTAASPNALTFEECQDLGLRAQVATTEALSVERVCEVDADCVEREAPTHCWPSCSPSIVASAAYVNTFEAQLSEGPAATYCAEFFESECSVAQHSCQPSLEEAIVGYVCLSEKCVARVQDSR